MVFIRITMNVLQYRKWAEENSKKLHVMDSGVLKDLLIYLDNILEPLLTTYLQQSEGDIPNTVAYHAHLALLCAYTVRVPDYPLVLLRRVWHSKPDNAKNREKIKKIRQNLLKIQKIQKIP